MKPKAFNFPKEVSDEMIRAIMDERKSVTRRVVKGIDDTARFIELEENPSVVAIDKHGEEFPKEIRGLYACFSSDIDDFPVIKAPYRPSDILYVRETWLKDAGRYMYKANYSDNEKFYRDGKEVSIRWRPSIHMPREAARLFLRVTDARVERLHDMQPYDIAFEGFRRQRDFIALWDSTIKKADLPRYGWAANPFVWVIEFERISKEEAL